MFFISVFLDEYYTFYLKFRQHICHFLKIVKVIFVSLKIARDYLGYNSKSLTHNSNQVLS